MINIKMKPAEVQNLSAKIMVVGVGGGGGNAASNMDSEGCETLIVNTDAQALEKSSCPNKVQLGVSVTGGLGAGSKPEVGKAAAEESLDEVMQYLEGVNMVFITAGMGGGTGTGAAPVIAKACRERGILTVGVVTKPFHFEGSHRMRAAEAGIEEMQNYVDTLIVIPNQNLFRIANEKTTFAEAFKMADSVLKSGVRGITDLIIRPGLVNLDFADVRTAMLEMGKAMMGTGEATGDKRAVEAAEAAINNPLLDDVSMKGAHGVIINVTGGYDMTLFEADEACNRIRDEVDPNANIIFGATFDESMEGMMRVSIVATGIEKESSRKNRTTTGGGSVDATGKGLLERATPNTNTEAATAQRNNAPSAPVSAPQTSSFVPATSYKPPAAPSPISAPKAPVAASEPEQEMFEQREFAVASDGAAEDMPQNTALRGTRYKDAFIPPKPVEAAIQAQATAPASFHATVAAATVSAPVLPAAQPQMMSAPIPSPGLQLNPPKIPAKQPAQQKKSLSLFERITGSVQQAVDGIREEAQPRAAKSQRVAPSPAMGGAAPAGPSQGSLNIDAPSKPKASDGDLDIPAFLRRQAN